MEDFKLRMEIQKQELELEHQRCTQKMELEMHRLQKEREIEMEVKSSTPRSHHSSWSFEGVSGVKNDEPMLLLTEAVKAMLEGSRVHQKCIVYSLHAPSIDVIKFDGDPLKYWPFITSFDNAVASKIHDYGTKLNTLIQSCTGEVNSLLQCCLVKNPDEGYELARKLLKERYGDNEIISQAWMSRILDRTRVKDLKDLRKFADDLRTCRETLITMGYLQEMETRSSLKSIASKLSNQDYNRWLSVNCAIKEKHNRSINLKDMVDFIDTLARERSDPVFGYTESYQATKLSKSGPMRNSYSTDAIPKSKTEHVLTTGSKKTFTTNYKCPKCNEAHYLNQCAGFRSMSVKDRISLVQRSNLCVNCFQYGHKGKDCSRS